MSALSAPDLALLRADGHKSNFYLKVVVPPTVYSAQVNDATITRGAVDIISDNPSGSMGDTAEGMTVWVGSAPGLYDKGVTRLRRAMIDNRWLVAENDDILWADNLYLTLKGEFLPWAKYPRIVPPATYYKDYDYGLIDQTTNWAPVPIMGSPDVLILPSAGGANVSFDGTASYAIKAGNSIVTYNWYSKGTPAFSTASSLTINYSTAQVDWVRLDVFDQSASGTTRRPIVITDLSDCYVDFECESMQGDIENGWSATFRVFGNADLTQFPDRALVFFFTRDYYGNTEQSMTLETGRGRTKLFGYILQDSVRKDPVTGDVTFEVGSVNTYLSKVGAPFPKFISDSAAPPVGDWTQGKTLTVRTALFYLLKWHSTLLEVADVFLENDQTPLGNAEFPDANAWEQLKAFAATARLAKAGVTKTGRIYVKRDVALIPVSERATVPVVAALTHADWDGEITITEQQIPSVALLEFNGIQYTGVPPISETSVFPIFSKAPGRAPLAHGERMELNGLALNSQNEANEWSGNVLAQRNRRYLDVTFPFDGNWVGVTEPALQEYFTLSLVGGDTNRGISWSSQKLIPRSVSVEFNWPSGYMRPTVTFEIDSGGGAPGQTGDYPVVEPTPTVDPPPVDPPPSPDDNPLENTWRGHVIYAGRNGRVYETFDFTGPTGAQPHWTDISDGLSVGSTDSIWMMIGDPFKPETYQYLIQNIGGASAFGTNSRLYKRSNGGAWQLIAYASDLAGPNFAHFEAIFGDINTEGYLAAYLSAGNSANDTLTLVRSLDRGSSFSGVAVVDSNAPFGISTIRQWQIIGAFKGNSAYAAGLVMYCASSRGTANAPVRVSVDKGATWVTNSSPAPFQEGYSSIYVDPNNQDVLFLYGVDAEGSGLGDGLRVSYDRGVSWSALQLAGEGNQSIFALNVRYQGLAAGAQEWVFFGGGSGNKKRLYRTTNGGSSYTYNTGTGLPTEPNGYPLQVSTVHDSPGKYYGFTYGQVDAGQPTIFVSSDYGATWADKSGAAGSNIPNTAGGCAGLLQIWTEAGLP
jgi:hypothetical protein